MDENDNKLNGKITGNKYTMTSESEGEVVGGGVLQDPTVVSEPQQALENDLPQSKTPIKRRQRPDPWRVVRPGSSNKDLHPDITVTKEFDNLTRRLRRPDQPPPVKLSYKERCARRALNHSGNFPEQLRLTRADVMLALRHNHGLQRAAAEELGVTPAALCNWINNYPDMREFCQELKELRLDKTENKLFKLIDDNESIDAVKFHLSTQGKKRGYQPKTIIAGDDESPLIVNIVPFIPGTVIPQKQIEAKSSSMKEKQIPIENVKNENVLGNVLIEPEVEEV